MDLSVTLAEAACLGAALAWAISLTMFRGLIGDHGARAVNLVKCLLSTVFLGLTTVAFGQLGPLLSAAPRELWLVALSGVVGLSLGDSALFASVHHLGVYRTLLLQSLAPVFTAALAAAFLGERLTAGQGLGAIIILWGVILVVAERRPSPGSSPGGFTRVGVIFALFAALGQGAGIVLAKEGMLRIPPLPASFLRLGASALGLVVLVALAGRGRATLGLLANPRSLLALVKPTVLGSYLGILMMTAGIAYAPATVVAVLLATTPVFSLFIDARLTGESLRARSLVGTLLTVLGVGVLALAASGNEKPLPPPGSGGALEVREAEASWTQGAVADHAVVSPLSKPSAKKGGSMGAVTL